MTAPRWIAEALEATLMEPGVGDIDVNRLAHHLLERLPIEAMATAAVGAMAKGAGDQVASVAVSMVGATIGVLAEDPDVVTLTELYQSACRVLDEAGVPYAVDKRRDDTGLSGPPQTGQLQLDLAARIRWLAQQRPTRLELQRVEAEREDLRSDAIHARALADVIGVRDAKIKELAERVGVLERDNLRTAMVDTRGEWHEVASKLAAERDNLRKNFAVAVSQVADLEAQIEGLEAEVADIEGQLFEVDPDEIGGEG